MFKTSPEHAAVMITEAVVQNPGSYPDCGKYLGSLLRECSRRFARRCWWRRRAAAPRRVHSAWRRRRRHWHPGRRSSRTGCRGICRSPDSCRGSAPPLR
ncbi:MAG: DUF6554 family protein, partial [Vulcanococcus sp.]